MSDCIYELHCEDEDFPLSVYATKSNGSYKKYTPERTCKRINNACSNDFSYLRASDRYCPRCGAKVVNE